MNSVVNAGKKTLPNLLIIGAMKSGTTSVFMDLIKHPQVFEPQDKEPDDLCDDSVLTDAGLAKYTARYSKARPGQIVCDASTTYSKRPDFEGVPQRAVKVLPSNFKVIYVVRHPIKRIISQHRHEFTEGLVGPCIDDVVQEQSRFLDYSRYAFQIEPWLEMVGQERIRVIQFEEYTANRESIVHGLWKFLDLDPQAGEQIGNTIYNQSKSKPVTNDFWEQVRTSWLYQAMRPLISLSGRKVLRELILPRAKLELAAPSQETIDWLSKEIAQDTSQLQALLGDSSPNWSEFKSGG